MRTTRIRFSCLLFILLVPVTFTIKAASDPLKIAKLTMSDGTNRTVRLDGVGCSVSICSRVLIKAKTANGSLVTIPLDTLFAIRDTTENSALFVLKNGSERRLSLLQDFRVLYIPNRTTGTERIDLAKIKSLEISEQTQ